MNHLCSIHDFSVDVNILTYETASSRCTITTYTAPTFTHSDDHVIRVMVGDCCVSKSRSMAQLRIEHGVELIWKQFAAHLCHTYPEFKAHLQTWRD